VKNTLITTVVMAFLICLGQATLARSEDGGPSDATQISGKFEETPVFKASEILEADMLAGDHFRVRETVGSDGYWDLYTVETEFGEFQAHGWFDLRNLIREINAIAHLDHLSRTEVFITSAIDRGLEPLDLALEIVQHPILTISQMPRGIARMFTRFVEKLKMLGEISRKLAGNGDPENEKAEEESTRLEEACARGDYLGPDVCQEAGLKDDMNMLAEHYFDVDDARRQWHEELGTDPYTSNLVLQNAITEVSWFDGMGSYGMKYVNIFRSRGFGVVHKVYKLAWRLDPVQLSEYQVDLLEKLKFTEEQISYFMGNAYISPLRKTAIIEALNELEGIEGSDQLLQWAAQSQSEDEALYTAITLNLVSWYNTQTSIRRFLTVTSLPVFETTDDRIVVLLPIDHLSWTEDVATLMDFAMQREDLERFKDREVWLLARASERARTELESRGWAVSADGYKALIASGEDLGMDEEE
jgi:hypothetical protein